MNKLVQPIPIGEAVSKLLLQVPAEQHKYNEEARAKHGWPRMYFLSQEQLGAMPMDERAAIETEYQQYRERCAEERAHRQMLRKNRDWFQKDRDEDIEERGLVERDAYSEEHPRQSSSTGDAL